MNDKLQRKIYVGLAYRSPSLEIGWGSDKLLNKRTITPWQRLTLPEGGLIYDQNKKNLAEFLDKAEIARLCALLFFITLSRVKKILKHNFFKHAGTWARGCLMREVFIHPGYQAFLANFQYEGLERKQLLDGIKAVKRKEIFEKIRYFFSSQYPYRSFEEIIVQEIEKILTTQEAFFAQINLDFKDEAFKKCVVQNFIQKDLKSRLIPDIYDPKFDLHKGEELEDPLGCYQYTKPNDKSVFRGDKKEIEQIKDFKEELLLLDQEIPLLGLLALTQRREVGEILYHEWVLWQAHEYITSFCLEEFCIYMRENFKDEDVHLPLEKRLFVKSLPFLKKRDLALLSQKKETSFYCFVEQRKKQIWGKVHNKFSTMEASLKDYYRFILENKYEKIDSLFILDSLFGEKNGRDEHEEENVFAQFACTLFDSFLNLFRDGDARRRKQATKKDIKAYLIHVKKKDGKIKLK